MMARVYVAIENTYFSFVFFILFITNRNGGLHNGAWDAHVIIIITIIITITAMTTITIVMVVPQESCYQSQKFQS